MELNALLGDISKKTEDEQKIIKIDLLSTGNILGVLQEDPSSWLKIGVAESKIDSKVIEKLIESRNQARANKDFKLADSIRDELSSMGIEIEDTSSGTIWKSI
jgi:cysteinyl-tRNA synthetase